MSFYIIISFATSCFFALSNLWPQCNMMPLKFSCTVHHSYHTHHRIWVERFCTFVSCLPVYSCLPVSSLVSAHCPTCVRRKSCGFCPFCSTKKRAKKKSQPFWATLSAQGSTSFLDPKECKADTKPICLLRNHFLMRHVCAKPKAKTPETTLKGNCLALSPSPSSMSWHSLKHDPTKSNQRATSGRGSCFLQETTKHMMDCQNCTQANPLRASKTGKAGRLSDLTKLNQKSF